VIICDFKNASEALAEWVREDKIKTQTTVAKGFDKVPEEETSHHSLFFN
jgi:NADPH-dependent curcumin reductase CurA